MCYLEFYATSKVDLSIPNINPSDLAALPSEQRNTDSMMLDTMTTEQILTVMNQADQTVPMAIGHIIANISDAVKAAVNAIQSGGRLVYIGAGTSGRLGVLDAVECPPTFGVDYNTVVALIAGREAAMFQAVEGAEDSPMSGQQDLESIKLTTNDFVVGIAASGRTPYVRGALSYAKSLGCTTASLSSNPQSEIGQIADIDMAVNVGPEVLTGSTRLKSGSAQKMVLNMLSTATMVKLGKVYQNLMVDVQSTNEKLKARAIRIVMQATECSQPQATQVLLAANGDTKLAILMQLTAMDAISAKAALETQQGHLRQAIENK